MAEQELRLSVIVVSYNTKDLTLAALHSLCDETRVSSMQIIVVDNASTDGSADAIESSFPRVELLRLEENIGFARANNLASERARGRYLLLLNPDTEIRDRAVDRLVEFAQRHPDARIWGGRTIFADGTPNHTSCWNRQTTWSLMCRGFGLTSIFKRLWLFNPEAIRLGESSGPTGVDIVSGCLLLIERDLWERLGGFDRDFFMYGEDADLCLRAREFGAAPMVDPSVTIVHHGGASEPVRADKIIKLFRAKSQLAQRHMRPWGGWLSRWIYAQHCVTRAAGWTALAAVGRPQAMRHARTWREVLSRRRSWMAIDGSSSTPAASSGTRTA